MPGGKGKGKGKTKNKGKDSAKMLLTLVQAGCRARTNAGDPICFGSSLATCDLPVNRGRCDRGFHVCAVPKCGKHLFFLSAMRRKKLGLDQIQRKEVSMPSKMEMLRRTIR